MDLLRPSCSHPSRIMRNGKFRPCAIRDFPDYLLASPSSSKVVGYSEPIQDNIPVDRLCVSSSSKVVDNAEPVQDVRHVKVVGSSSSAASQISPRRGEMTPTLMDVRHVKVVSSSSSQISPLRGEMTPTLMTAFDGPISDKEAFPVADMEPSTVVQEEIGLGEINRQEIEQKVAKAIPEYKRGKDSSTKLPVYETQPEGILREKDSSTKFPVYETQPEGVLIALHSDVLLLKREEKQVEKNAKESHIIENEELDRTYRMAIRDSHADFENKQKQKDISDLPNRNLILVSQSDVPLQEPAMEMRICKEIEIEQQNEKRNSGDFSIIEFKKNRIYWLEDDHVVAFQRVKKTHKKVEIRKLPKLGKSQSPPEIHCSTFDGEQHRSSSLPGKEPMITQVCRSKWKAVSDLDRNEMVCRGRQEEMQLPSMGKEVKSKSKFGIYRHDIHKSVKRKILSETIASEKKAKLSLEETSGADAVSARKAMVTSLRLYESVRRKLLQDEEKSKQSRKGTRVDLQVLSFKDHSLVCADKVVGSIPGMEVGDIFLFRAEIAFAKVHCPIQGGIEFVTKQISKWDRPVAIGIISNVGQDGEDNGEELIYMGQGGKNTDNKQIADQKLVRGNLAMDGSRELGIPVRVIRGIKDVNSPSGKVYIYDGLYSVAQTTIRKGSGGFDEFQFTLQRLPNQPELGSSRFKLADELKRQSPSSRMNIVVRDLSKGKESQPICVENTVDENVPLEFEYLTKVRYPDGVRKVGTLLRCVCNDNCISGKCSCISRNGDELPYLNGRYLVREKDYIFECGIQCACSEKCLRTAPEKGKMFRLEVFRTADRGWGVQSLEVIPAGSFVCEYTGRMVFGAEMIKTVMNKEHVLDLRRLPVRRPYWGDMPNIFPDRSSPNIMPDIENPDLIIDATTSGNVARFINHSCSPNLLVQKVVSEQEDMRFPRIKLFAMDNIPPLKELTFDYGAPLENEDYITCLCGSFNCRGKL